jgi:hypothetical protein
MAPRVERLVYNFGITGRRESVLNVTAQYAPVVSGAVRHDLTDQMNLPYLVRSKPGRIAPFESDEALYEDLAERSQRLIELLEARLKNEHIENDGKPVEVTKSIVKLWVRTETGIRSIQIDTRVQSGVSAERIHLVDLDLTDAQRRLLDSITTTVDSFCWKHLRHRFEIETASTVRPMVFVSYRKGHQAFAKALAERLGREGFVPWFDEWEVRAGDSLPGKIEAGLGSSVAFLAVITRDYADGKWATEELEAAIARRVNEGFPIIPILLEECKKPALIGHLVHVDFSENDPQTFEGKMAEIIDGINRLDRNPFR